MQDYIVKTKGTEEEFKLLTKKDRITSRIIEKRMRELIAFYNQSSYMKTALVIKGCVAIMPVPLFVLK